MYGGLGTRKAVYRTYIYVDMVVASNTHHGSNRGLGPTPAEPTQTERNHEAPFRGLLSPVGFRDSFGGGSLGFLRALPGGSKYPIY